MLRAASIACLMCALAAATPVAGQGASAESVIARARTVTGGAAAWNALLGVTETGRLSGRRYRRVLDPIRYGLRIETTDAAGAALIQGYNGLGEWRILADGQATGSASREDLAEIRSDAYFAVQGYYFSSRFERRMSLLGERRQDGRTFDVVRVEPAGGEPRELWFDRRTGLLGMMVDETGPRQGRTEFGDWKRVGGVMIPFSARTYGGGRGVTEDLVITAVTFEAPDRDLFSLPRPKVAAAGR